MRLIDAIKHAGVLHALALLGSLRQLDDISSDPVGQVLANAALPKHVHLKLPARTSRDR